MIKNEKGILLLTTYLIVSVLFVFSGMFFYKAFWDARAGERHRHLVRSFYCAEAGVDRAIAGLPGITAGVSNAVLNSVAGEKQGEYSYRILTVDPFRKWKIECQGFSPDEAQPVITRSLEVYVAKRDLPDNFWENAIYSAGNVRITGKAYTIDGNIRYGGSMVPSTLDPVLFTGETFPDPDISPLIKLDFEGMRQIAATQIKADGSDNIYTAEEIASGSRLPEDFWYDTSDPDPLNWMPNVVYVETDLVLNGNIDIGGFMLVVGDVISDPDETSETVINGSGEIDGCVYTTGQFRVNGGGNGLNVLGGVWSGGDGVRLNGSIFVEYHKEYMDAIRTIINPSSILQIISWREV